MNPMFPLDTCFLEVGEVSPQRGYFALRAQYAAPPSAGAWPRPPTVTSSSDAPDPSPGAPIQTFHPPVILARFNGLRARM